MFVSFPTVSSTKEEDAVVKRQDQPDEVDEQVADRRAQIEALQSVAADAEARALTAQAALSEVQAARQSAEGEAEQLRAALAAARAEVKDAAAKYRAARLSTAPDVPPELVSASEDITQIDSEFEAAQRLVSELRENMQQAAREGSRARVPAGSPPRRAPDVSTLSATEKIRLGLQQLTEKEGR